MSRFRLSPTPAQETALLWHCAQARFGWNLALEQANFYGTAGRKASPNFAAQCRVEKVNAAYTSQRCHACGYTAAESRESQARFGCRSCGHTAHADLNAARNIAAGHAGTARGGPAVAGPVNREPQHASLRVA